MISRTRVSLGRSHPGWLRVPLSEDARAAVQRHHSGA
jgi:hypothetical protein